jgi:hypothetical protein
MSLDWSRIERVICKIARGLYFHETRTIFPTNGQICIRVLSLVPYQDAVGLREPITQALMPELIQAGPRRLGRGEFAYTFRQIDSEKRPELISWLMSFYDGILIAVYTYPPDIPENQGFQLLARA